MDIPAGWGYTTPNVATTIVHTPQGAIPACEKHAQQLEALGRWMGYHTNRTRPDHPTTCTNCMNESLNKRGPTP